MIAQGLSIVAAALVIGTVCLLLLGWGGLLGFIQRLGLALFAAGLVLAAIPRFTGRPPGWGDLIMLAGLALYFCATYGPRILRHVDGLDGAVDNHIRAGAVDIDASAITRALTVDRRRRRGF